MNYRDLLLMDYFDEGAGVADALESGLIDDDDEGVAIEARANNMRKPGTITRNTPEQKKAVERAEAERTARMLLAAQEKAKKEKAENEAIKNASEKGKKDATKKFMTKRNAGIAGGAALGVAGGAAATASAIKLAKAKKDLKAHKITQKQYDALKKRLVGGIAAGATGAALGTVGAVASAKKLKEACDIAYIASYMDTVDSLNEAYNSLDSSYDYYDEDYDFYDYY